MNNERRQRMQEARDLIEQEKRDPTKLVDMTITMQLFIDLADEALEKS